MDAETLRIRFDNFFDKEIDYRYFKTILYIKTMMDQASEDTYTSILIVGDDSQKN